VYELKDAQNSPESYQADAKGATELHVDWMWAERRKAKGTFSSAKFMSNGRRI